MNDGACGNNGPPFSCWDLGGLEGEREREKNRIHQRLRLPPICLPVCQPACLLVCLSACLPAFLSVGPSTCLFVCLPVYLPACLPACRACFLETPSCRKKQYSYNELELMRNAEQPRSKIEPLPQKFHSPPARPPFGRPELRRP